MNRYILQIALPSIVSNITVPLLGLADTAIAGHLGNTASIGTIAVGGMLFNMIYWLFGFLRMGTGGLTSQAFGTGDREESLRILVRSLGTGVVIALLLVLLQMPLAGLAFRFIDATPAVEELARLYFMRLIWGAPAVLCLYSFTGWFLGMQNARYPMYLAIVQNLVNIIASLLLVFVLDWGIEGIATGTLVSQYAGLLLAIFLWLATYRPARAINLRGCIDRSSLVRFFAVNRDIFLRTLCLIAVTTWFTSAGAAQGDLPLAANALLMQLFLLFSYVMDGFAYAGEALGGRFFGAGDARSFRRATSCLFVWGTGLAFLFTAIYALGGAPFLSLLTDRSEVAAYAMTYLPYATAIPLLSFAAFLFDGLYIGATATRPMLVAMLIASAAFFLLYFLLRSSLGNHALWISFLLYLFLRGGTESLFFRSIVRKIS